MKERSEAQISRVDEGKVFGWFLRRDGRPDLDNEVEFLSEDPDQWEPTQFVIVESTEFMRGDLIVFRVVKLLVDEEIDAEERAIAEQEVGIVECETAFEEDSDFRKGVR